MDTFEKTDKVVVHKFDLTLEESHALRRLLAGDIGTTNQRGGIHRILKGITTPLVTCDQGRVWNALQNRNTDIFENLKATNLQKLKPLL